MRWSLTVEFLAALMTSVIDNPRKVAEYIYSCRQMGISVLPPDINEGDGRFTATKEGIRYGLYAIKSVGRPVVDSIVEEREANGPYKTLQNFIERVASREVNKRTVENLIKAGACDGLDGNRQQMMMIYSMLIDNQNQEKKKMMAGQMSLFDLVPEEERQANGSGKKYASALKKRCSAFISAVIRLRSMRRNGAEIFPQPRPISCGTRRAVR